MPSPESSRSNPRIALAGLILLAATLPTRAQAADAIADALFEGLQQERGEAGIARFERRPALDAVARERALTVAGLPHAERLRHAEPIADELRRNGVRWFRSAAMHLDMVRGYPTPADAFLRSWNRYGTAWAKVRDGGYEAIGLATARGEDGWIVLVAVLLDDLEVPDDLPALERRVVDEINRIRRGRGLEVLAIDEQLARVARDHSRAMAVHGFVDHVDRRGQAPADRVSGAGLAFRAVGENIHVNRGAADPVRSAVDGWMDSRGHRKQILDPRFGTTGVGIALDDEGKFYVTQLFLRPGR